MATIYRLPPEILAHIFNILKVESDYSNIRYRFLTERWNWMAATHVCSYWHSVALNSPNLWSDIHYSDSVRKVQAHLKLSRDADLQVEFWNSDLKYRNKIGILTEVLGEIARISKLQIGLERQELMSWESMRSCLQSSATRLKFLSLSSTTCLFSLPNIEIDAPALDDFEIGSFILPTNFTFPSNLSNLALQECTNVSSKSLARCLRASPKLKILSLIQNSSIFDLDGDEEVIPMNHLRRLKIAVKHSNGELMGSLFNRIKLPMDIDWTCNFSDIDGQLNDFLKAGYYIDWLKDPATYKHFQIQIMPYFLGMRLKCARTQRINPVEDSSTNQDVCTKTLFISSASDAPGRYSISSCFTRFGELIKSCSLISVKSFAIELCFGGTTTEDDWLQMLPSLRSVRSFTLRSFSDRDKHRNTTSFCRVLDHHINNSIVLPKLEILSIGLVGDAKVEEELSKSLSFGLRSRRHLGFGVKTLRIHSKYPVNEIFAAVTDCVEEYVRCRWDDIFESYSI